MKQALLNFYVLLVILFLGLKLGGAITWSWIWVASVAWVPALIVAAAVLVVLIYSMPGIIREGVKAYREEKARLQQNARTPGRVGVRK